jgi:hypothetical protein
MADLRTSAEAAAAALTGSELIRLSQLGANKKGTPQDLRTYIAFNTIVKGITQDRRHGAPFNASNLSAGAHAVNTYRGFPVEIRERVTIDKIGIEVTAGTSGKMRIIIHADVDGYPGAYLGESGELTVTAPGVYEGLAGGGSLTLAPGLYWFILWGDTGNTVRSVNAAAMNPAFGHSATGGTILFGTFWNSSVMAYSSVTVVDPYPAGATIGNAATLTPHLFYRAL